MNIALLFNSDDPKYHGYYGVPIEKTVFNIGIIQNSQRHMKISVGDVTIYGKIKNWDEYDKLTKLTYFAHTWYVYHEARLTSTFRTATVYALVFENMTKEIASALHEALVYDQSYLGFLEVDYAYGPHLALFRNSMIGRYRVQSTNCRVFFSMSEEDTKDESTLAQMMNVGYVDVDWEDRGAHRTIFDDFDTIQHFERVAAFRDAIAPFLTGAMDDASELVMILEDLNPQLFNSLGSAVAALKRATTEEDVAQASISGRRYLERLADTLFPPRDVKYNGRSVRREQYRNRIWAFINENVDDQNKLQTLGAEVDHLVREFNAGLHSDQDKTRVLRALAECGSMTAALLALDPSTTRKPYLAHQKRMIDFFNELTASRAE